MPIYQCSAPVGLLTGSMKADIATAITDAHVEMTGAPRVFVHVFFNELPPGVACSAGEVDTKISGIQGAIRAGRPLDVKQKLIKQISAAWSQITGQPERQLLAGLSEIDSDISMEPGDGLAELGHGPAVVEGPEIAGRPIRHGSCAARF